MPRYVIFVTAALLASTAVPAVASARTARVTADLHMRAGPSTRFPVVTTVPDGADVEIFGCVDGYSWCDTAWSGRRGWIDADYLTYSYQNSYVPIIDYGAQIDLPILAFSIGGYWDNYYRDEPWYGRRSHWRSVWHDDHHARHRRHDDHHARDRGNEHHRHVDRTHRDHRQASGHRHIQHARHGIARRDHSHVNRVHSHHSTRHLSRHHSYRHVSHSHVQHQGHHNRSARHGGRKLHR